MKFTKQFLLDTLDDDIIKMEDKIVGKGRWRIDYRLVFKHEGKFYASVYSVGATESQDESPWEYAGDEIECAEVRPVEKVVTVYEPVTEPKP